MSSQIENLEKNMVKLTITVEADEVEKAIERAYQKQKSKISVPGFRKGKVPRKMVEKMYGAGVFYEDAANDMIQTAYTKAVEESELDIVSRPKIDVTQLEAGKEFIFTAEVAVKPAVELGEYLGVEVPKADVEVTEDEINAEIDREREQNSRIVTVEDRAVEDKDMVTIDFEGFVDGVAFEGGQASNYSLTLGSNQFIPGFEDQVIGHKIGDEFEINLTFPDDYHQKSLASQKATFGIILHAIKEVELPKLDDDFVKDISEFDDVESFKEDIKKSIQSYKDNQADLEVEHSLADIVISNMKADIPQIMIDNRVAELKSKFENNLKNQGLDIDTYLKYIGQSLEDFNKSFVPEAEKNVKLSLALKKIIELEKIEASESDIDESIASLAKEYKITEDKVKQVFSKEDIIENVKVDKAIKLIKDSAKITEVIAEQK